MGLFSGITKAEATNRDKFYNPDHLYVISISAHDKRASTNPEKIGYNFVYVRGNVLETTDPALPPGTQVVEMIQLKPATTAEMNLKVNGMALANLRNHVVTCARAMFEQRRADGIEGFADLTDEQIEQEVTGLDDEGKLEEFIDGLTDAHLAEGVLLGVSTSNYVTKKGANFTQITYSTDVDSIRNLISRRAA